MSEKDISQYQKGAKSGQPEGAGQATPAAKPDAPQRKAVPVAPAKPAP